MALHYKKKFDPAVLAPKAPKLVQPRRPFVADYEYDEPIVLAINVALATGRPLLLRGEPGSGKSTLAEDVARLLHWRYFEQVVSSTIEADELLCRIDHVSRIADAQALGRGLPLESESYLEPGVLWWAFAPTQARRRGGQTTPKKPPASPEVQSWELKEPDNAPAVVLIDEIDKAEPDFPNDLLVPLGSLRFHVRALGIDFHVKAESMMQPLVMITTNDERDLPPAFVRRCVLLELEAPVGDRLRKIARRHFAPGILDDQLLTKLLERYDELRASAIKQKLRPPGTAEFLDAARAIIELEDASFAEQDWAFSGLTRATLWKHRHPPQEAKAATP